MRKRLRRKQGTGEFAGYFFGVSYVLDDVSTQRANLFLDLFVEQAIEANGLSCHAEHHDEKEWDFSIGCATRVKPVASQRDAVVAWLKSRKELARFQVEELVQPRAT